MAVAAALKVAEAPAAGTMTDAGTVKAALLEEIATAVPPVGAAPESVTVQAILPGGVNEVGVQVRLVSISEGCHPWTPMAPPAPETATALPSPKAPIVPLTETGTDPLLVLVASVTVTTAATPLPIVVEFIPDAKQIVEPVPVLHWIVLLAALSTAPAATLTEVTSAEE